MVRLATLGKIAIGLTFPVVGMAFLVRTKVASKL